MSAVMAGTTIVPKANPSNDSFFHRFPPNLQQLRLD
jgi:hypothetical protein